MKRIRCYGHKGLEWIQDVGLLIIAAFTLIAMGVEITSMIEVKRSEERRVGKECRSRCSP